MGNPIRSTWRRTPGEYVVLSVKDVKWARDSSSVPAKAVTLVPDGAAEADYSSGDARYQLTESEGGGWWLLAGW